MGPHIFATFIFVVAAISSISGEIYFQKGSPHVKLANNALLSGRVEYSREGRPFNSFIGVPFGVIPERFQESEPAPAWEGVYNAVKPGHVCVQPHTVGGKVVKVGEEDCLNLNVYVPMNNTQQKGGLNVMVWVHGGGFVQGTGYGYGGKFFMDEDIILVMINYRLGVFGFLSTGDSVVPGNNGMKDQVLALRWVHENIKNFGGNPKKVTVFGESAGGAAVHYLLLSSTTEGLFQRAISQSGSALAPWAYSSNPKAAAMSLTSHLKCSSSSEISSEEILTCLKKFTAEELNTAHSVGSPRWPASALPLQFVPVKEPLTSSTPNKTPFLTESPWTLVVDKSASRKEIPSMVGTTENEGCSLYAGHIMQDQKMVDELNSNWDKIILRTNELDRLILPEDHVIVSDKIRKFYFGDQPISTENRQSLTDLYSDAFFTYSVRKSALEAVSKGKKAPVYLYQYAHMGPVSAMNALGFPMAEEDLKQVGHADELFLQFNMDNLLPSVADAVKPDSADEKFSKNFVKLWVSFAIHGKPKHTWGTSTEEWKPISRAELEGKSPLRWYKISSTPGYIEDSVKERASFWDKLYNDHLLHSFKSSPSTGKKTEL